MQASDLVELAALVSTETPALLSGGGRFSSDGIDAYWITSKCRLDRWSRRLKSACDPMDHGTANSATLEPSCLSACAEILTSEILTRVWSAAASASDRLAQLSELAPITQSILFGHQEARHRVLNLIAVNLDRPLRQVSKLDQLRRICERWTDLLLAPLAEMCDTDAFAHDAARVHDFAQDRLDEQASRAGQRAQEILHASLQSTFRNRPVLPSRNADLNAQIAAAILACLDLGRIDSSDVRLESLSYYWLFHARMTSAANDAQCLVDELLFDG